MKKAKKVIGYVCDIPVNGTDVVISKEDQRLRLLKYVQNENLELIGIYEDTEFTDEFMDRAGVQKILNYQKPFDILLVERVWCLSRKRKELDPFLEKLDNRQVQLVASSYLWDCVSQQIRHRYTGKLADKLRQESLAIAERKRRRDAA